MSNPKKKLGGLSKPAQTLQAILDSMKSTQIQTMTGEPSKLVIGHFTKDGVEYKAYPFWPRRPEGEKLFRGQVECSTYYLDNSKQKTIARGRYFFLPRYQIDGRPMNKDQANLAVIMDLQDLDPDDKEIAHLAKLRTDKLQYGTNSPKHLRNKQEAKKLATPMKDKDAKDRFSDPSYQLGSFYEQGDDDGDDDVVDRFHQRNQELFDSHRSDVHFRPMSYEAINELVSQTSEELHQQLEATAMMIVQEAEAKKIPRTQTIRFQILQALNFSPVSLSTSCLPDIMQSNMGNIHTEYLKYLERKDFTKVLSDSLIKIYLTDPRPSQVMHKVQSKKYTSDDRQEFFDWCLSSKAESMSIDIQDFKFCHSVALLISDKLQLGHTDVDWLIINQPTFQGSRYKDEACFFDAARDYHTR